MFRGCTEQSLITADVNIFELIATSAMMRGGKHFVPVTPDCRGALGGSVRVKPSRSLGKSCLLENGKKECNCNLGNDWYNEGTIEADDVKCV